MDQSFLVGHVRDDRRLALSLVFLDVNRRMVSDSKVGYPLNLKLEKLVVEEARTFHIAKDLSFCFFIFYAKEDGFSIFVEGLHHHMLLSSAGFDHLDVLVAEPLCLVSILWPRFVPVFEEL